MRHERAALGGAVVALCLFGAGAAIAQRTGSQVGITHELALSVSDYKYTEPDMSLRATKLGGEYSVTFLRRDGWFVRGSLRGAMGDAEYRGSGRMNGVPDLYYENRWGVGKRFVLGRHTLAPDLGLGYRHLYNDLRGVTDTGAVGYRRDSRYLTARVGLRHSFRLPNGASLESSAERDHLLLGRQDTRLSDIEGRGPWRDVPDTINYQYRGDGWRLGCMYRVGAWSVGSYLHLWRIEKSDKDHIRVVKTTGSETWTVWEPKNDTREVGVKVAYRF
jgi:hypothetical protein